MLKKISATFAVILLFALAAPQLSANSPNSANAAEDSAGSVIAARRDAWAERGKVKPQLYSKSPVFNGDRLTTNPVGRLQVLFNDDSVLMLAPDSQATITEYVYNSAAEGGNAFNINLARGVTQLISGKIVENQPGAMRVETPEITVGIQGTKVGVESNGGVSKVMQLYGSADKPTLVICGEMQKKYELKENGTVLIMNAEAQCVPQIRKMTDDEYLFMQQLAIGLSGPSVNAATPNQLAAADSPSTTVELPALVVEDSGLVVASNDGLSILSPAIPPLLADFSGTYAGTLSGMSGPYNSVYQPGAGSVLENAAWAGTFNMDINNLASGPQITNLYIGAENTLSYNQYGFEVSLSGNVAQIGSDGSFNFTTSGGFNDAYTDIIGTPGNYLYGSYPDVNGVKVSNGQVGNGEINFDWQLTGLPGGTRVDYDIQGSASGTKQP